MGRLSVSFVENDYVLFISSEEVPRVNAGENT